MSTTVKASNALQNIETLCRRYEDIQANAANLNTVCDCISGISQAMGKLPREHPVPFDTILSFGAETTTQCESMVTCEHCCTHWQAITTMQSVLDLVLALFEADCSAYALGDVDLACIELDGTARPSHCSTLSLLSRHPASSLDARDNRVGTDCFPERTTLAAVCRASPMTWGEFEIQGEDAQLLARVLLRRRLTDLGGLIGRFKLVLESGWHWSRPHQSYSLQEREASLMESMDRLFTLVGLLE